MSYEAPPYNAKQSRRTFVLIFITCFLFFAIWAYVFFKQKPRVAEGALSQVIAIPLHTEIRQGGTMREGYGGGVEKTDELYVWVHIDMKNLTSDVPLYATKQRATLDLNDGEEKDAYAASPREVAMVRALPRLQQVPGALLPRELTLKPGQTASGLALFAFPVTEQTWKQRRELSVSISFQWQRDLALREPRTDH